MFLSWGSTNWLFRNLEKLLLRNFFTWNVDVFGAALKLSYYILHRFLEFRGFNKARKLSIVFGSNMDNILILNDRLLA